MKQNHIQWLYDQLPDLVSGGVVSAETADKLRRHYGPAPKTDGRRIALVLFGLLGAVLIGGGIILLIAYNWRELTRPVRAAISFAPLVVAQVLAGGILWQRAESTAWREGSGAFLALTIGASIALVSQTYHIPGDLGSFMLSWTLLALPLAYLMGATLPALFYLVGILVWTGDSITSGAEGLWFWLLLAAVLPYIAWTARGNRYHPRPVILCLTTAIVAAIGIGITMHDVLGHQSNWIIVFSAYFSGLYLAGCRWWDQAPTAWQRPFQIVGALGGVVLALVLSSFKDAWHIPRGSRDLLPLLREQPLDGIVCGVIVVGAIGLWVMAARDLFRRTERPAGAATRLLLGALPLVALLGVVLVRETAQKLNGVYLVNAYLVALGIIVLVGGLRAHQLSRVNAGMFLLATVILLRFIDAELGMVIRGIAFILLGSGFLVTNLVLIRKKGGPS